MNLLPFTLAAMLVLVPKADEKRLEPLGSAIASAVESLDAPLFKGDETREKSAAFLVAIAYRESAFQLGALGDKGESFCAFQIHLPNGQKTREGWTGAELRESPEKCVAVAIRILRDSMRWCPAHPLAIYAAGPGGCTSEKAQRISRDRMSIAQRIVRSLQP